MSRAPSDAPIDSRAELPGYRTLAWMAFMQPVALERRLKASGVEQPDLPLRALLQRRGPPGSRTAMYVRRMLGLLGVVAISTLVPAVLVLLALDLPQARKLQLAAGALAVVAMLGALAVLRPSTKRDALRFALSVSVVACSVLVIRFSYGTLDPEAIDAVRLTLGLFLCLVVGLGGRFAFATLKLVAFGVGSLVPRRIFASMARHLSSVSVLVGSRLLVVLTVGAAIELFVSGSAPHAPSTIWLTLVLGVIALPRLCLYPFEAALSGVLYALDRSFGVSSLASSPVLFHELSYLPYPWLEAHLLRVADRDPALARRVLDACDVAPGQREIRKAVLARLQARELEVLARGKAFHEVMELAGPHWLPGFPERADPLLARFAELGGVLAEAHGSAPHVALRHLDHADKLLRALEDDLARDDSPLGLALRLTRGTWRELLARMLPRAQREADRTLVNPFRVRALDPARGDDEIFRGREALVREVRAILVDDEHGATIALLGPRRCGKTSLLKLLPTFVPGTLCVYVDPQHSAVTSPAGFLVALAGRVREATLGRLDLPALADDASFDEGSAWLRALEERAGDHRILICIDELERLEELVADHPRDVGRLLGLLQATMQHGSHVRLLLSAKAPFEREGSLWNDAFIGAQEIWIDHLDEAEAIALLTLPIEDFPRDAIPIDVARLIAARTGGQPFLLQAYGNALVMKLNHEARRAAVPSDVEAIEAKVLELHRTYFANVLDEAPALARAALVALAEDRPPLLDAATRRELRNRRLLTADDQLRIPVLGRWIHDEWPG